MKAISKTPIAEAENETAAQGVGALSGSNMGMRREPTESYQTPTPTARANAALMALEGRQLRTVLAASAPELRRKLAAAVIGRTRGRAVLVSRIGHGRVAVLPPSWNIRCGVGAFETDAGSHLLSLIASLYGVSQGKAAVRVLETVTGAKLDPSAARDVGAAIDAWAGRNSSSEGLS